MKATISWEIAGVEGEAEGESNPECGVTHGADNILFFPINFFRVSFYC